MGEIDGAQQSGSGTIVRYAVAMAALLGQPLHLVNAHARREPPGLRPQHLAAVRACAELCGATTTGLDVGSHKFTFVPGGRISGGAFDWDIGTAGSTTMLALSIMPLSCFADAPVTARITGGVFQDFAPSPHHLQHVLAPVLRRMGVTLDLRVLRAGYVPRGAGRLELQASPTRAPLRALTLTEQGQIREVAGIAFASHLAERRVSERMATACEQRLAQAGLSPAIQRVEDIAALHPGASLAVWATTSTGCRLGADRAGALRRPAEAIGRWVAEALLADLATGATVDRHLADQSATRTRDDRDPGRAAACRTGAYLFLPAVGGSYPCGPAPCMLDSVSAAWGAVEASRLIGMWYFHGENTLASGRSSFCRIYPHRNPPGTGAVGAAGGGIPQPRGARQTQSCVMTPKVVAPCSRRRWNDRFLN